MKRSQRLIIGTRGSELALWQAHTIQKMLLTTNKNLSVEIKIIKTKGDKIQKVALSKIGDKGLFTKELEECLLRREIDLAVHSLKDLQTAIPDGLTLACITKRHAVEDVLIARKKGVTLDDLPENAIVATGSLRRRSQLLHYRPDIRIAELRGNVPTRIEKFLKSDWDGIILARAGVERLKLNNYISSVISTDIMLPAVGQGALGIEVAVDNELTINALRPLNDEDTSICIRAERTFLKALEGGCQVPMGAYGIVKHNGFYFDAIVGSIDGTIVFRERVRSSKSNPELVGSTVANDLLKAGARKILEEIYGRQL